MRSSGVALGEGAEGERGVGLSQVEPLSTSVNTRVVEVNDGGNHTVPGESSSWYWDPLVALSPVANAYEPQGELLEEEAQAQHTVRNNFRFLDQRLGIPHLLVPQSRKAESRIHKQASETRDIQSLEDHSISELSRFRAEGLAARDRRERVDESGPIPATSEPISVGVPNLYWLSSRNSRRGIEVAGAMTEASNSSNSAPEEPYDTAQPSGAPLPERGVSGSVPSAQSDQKRRILEAPAPSFLPAGKVFPVQIGSELFRLSGASISSDGNAMLSKPVPSSLL
jgi:hypothetical protein